MVDMPPYQQMGELDRKALSDDKALAAAARKIVDANIAALEQVMKTPVGKDFAIPIDSPMYHVLRQYATRKPSDLFVTFQAISSAEGGMLAYNTDSNRRRTFRDPKGALTPSGQPVMVTICEPDLTKTFFVRGYTQPIVAGEQVKLKVKKTEGMAWIDEMPYFEYVVIE